MHYLMRADLVDDVLVIATGWREHAVLLSITLLLWPLFFAMLATGYIWQKRKIKYRNSPEVLAEIKRQQELCVEDDLVPWGDYADYLGEPLTPEEVNEILSWDDLTSRRFGERMRAGNNLFHFATSAHTWQHNAGRAGVVLIRKGGTHCAHHYDDELN